MFIEVTINKQAPTDDGKSQVIRTKALLNCDTIFLIEPRIEGGALISLVNGKAIVIGETKSEVALRMGVPQEVDLNTEEK